MAEGLMLSTRASAMWPSSTPRSPGYRRRTASGARRRRRDAVRSGRTIPAFRRLRRTEGEKLLARVRLWE